MSEFVEQSSQTVKRITIMVEYVDHDQTEVLVVKNPEMVDTTAVVETQGGKIRSTHISIATPNPEAVYKRVMV